MRKEKLKQDHVVTPRATELDYLTWFRINAYFGEYTEDVVSEMNEEFMESTGSNLPLGWNVSADGER